MWRRWGHGTTVQKHILTELQRPAFRRPSCHDRLQSFTVSRSDTDAGSAIPACPKQGAPTPVGRPAGTLRQLRACNPHSAQPSWWAHPGPPLTGRTARTGASTSHMSHRQPCVHGESGRRGEGLRVAPAARHARHSAGTKHARRRWPPGKPPNALHSAQLCSGCRLTPANSQASSWEVPRRACLPTWQTSASCSRSSTASSMRVVPYSSWARL